MSELKSINIRSGEVERTLWYRPGTSDQNVIEDTFGKKPAFDLRRLSRFAEIRVCYADIVTSARMPLIVDAGANIGASAVYFAIMLPGSVVLALEPEQENWELLRKNVDGLCVTPMLGALASKNGHVRVIDQGLGRWAFRTEAVESGVQSYGINDLYLVGAAAPFIVKIDIEGGERDVFSANTDWIDRTPVLIVEPHDWMLPKSRTTAPLLHCLATRPRDFVLMGEHIVSIAHDLDCWQCAP